MDAAAELGKSPARKHQIHMEMSRLTWDGIAEPVSRDQILRRERGHREELIFFVQLTTSRIGNLTRLVLTLAICDGHAYIRTYIQYFGGLLPDIILLTQCYFHRGRTRLNAMKRFGL